MKRKLILTAVVSLFLSYFIFNAISTVNPESSRVELGWVPFEEAVLLSQETGRLILVDITPVPGDDLCGLRKRRQKTYSRGR